MLVKVVVNRHDKFDELQMWYLILYFPNFNLSFFIMKGLHLSNICYICRF